MLLSGDIQPNPGSTRYPCSICYKPVKVNQKAILCDDCGLWSHCKCCGVLYSQYMQYCQRKDFPWVCSCCHVSVLAYHDCSQLSFNSATSFQDDNQDNFAHQAFNSLDFDKTGIRIVHINARSLVSIADEVSCIIANGKIDVLAISETWLDSGINDKEICPINYQIIRKNRNRIGGSVAVIISQQLRFCVRSDISCNNIESVWLELFPKSKSSVIICCSYRPPSSNDYFDNFMVEYERAVNLSGDRSILIVGDLNCELCRLNLTQ